MYTQSSMYGANPCLYLAQTPYARITGQYTNIDSSLMPGVSTYLQPMFVDTNLYTGKSGIQAYPTLVGTNNYISPEQYQQQQYYSYMQQQAQQQQYYAQNQQPLFYGQQMPGMYYSSQQVGFIPATQTNTQNNFFSSFISTFQQALGNLFS